MPVNANAPDLDWIRRVWEQKRQKPVVMPRDHFQWLVGSPFVVDEQKPILTQDFYAAIPKTAVVEEEDDGSWEV